jgi:NAD(P)H-flavin reductase
LELRGPIGGPFTWRTGDGGPLLVVADGAGLVPLIAMLRHRAARSSTVDARLLISTGSRYITRSRAIHPPRGGGSPGASTLTCRRQ